MESYWDWPRHSSTPSLSTSMARTMAAPESSGPFFKIISIILELSSGWREASVLETRASLMLLSGNAVRSTRSLAAIASRRRIVVGPGLSHYVEAVLGNTFGLREYDHHGHSALGRYYAA